MIENSDEYSKIHRKGDSPNFISTNRFSPLQEMDTENDDSHKQDYSSQEDQNKQSTQNENNRISKSNSTKRLPPIVIHGGVIEHSKIVKQINDIVKNKFFLKYHKDSTEVFTTS